ncbi:MAG: homoserine dehydrogenase [Caldimicrobium sp.]
MEEIKIALLGFGTVGQGVYEILQKNKDIFEEKLGIKITVKKILVRDTNKKREVKAPLQLFTTDFKEILDDKEIAIVCELMGGLEPARSYVISALSKGKQVVTANKAILAEYGAEIFDEARKHGAFLGFEASVGGGIPVIKTLNEALIGNRIERITGIINGTTNYILTKMLEQNISFDKALEEAKSKGYAEADPSLDLKGYDSAHKLSILASLAFGSFIPFKRVYVEGIENIDLMDLKFAKSFGYIIKLIAEAKRDKDKVEVRVHPALLSENHILTSVRLNYNAILIKGDFVGEILLYGLGAGREPTASAVVGDIVSAIEYLLSKKSPLIPYPSKNGSVKIKPMKDCVFKYYFRFSAIDRPGVLSKISGILGKYGISIASVVQIGRQKKKGAVPIVMLTHEAKEEKVERALAEINTLDVLKGETKKLRIIE